MSTIKHVIIYISVCRNLLILQLSDLDLLFFKSNFSFIMIVAATFPVLSLIFPFSLEFRIASWEDQCHLVEMKLPFSAGSSKNKTMHAFRLTGAQGRFSPAQKIDASIATHVERRSATGDISLHIFDNILPRRCRASWGQAPVKTTNKILMQQQDRTRSRNSSSG